MSAWRAGKLTAYRGPFIRPHPKNLVVECKNNNAGTTAFARSHAMVGVGRHPIGAGGQVRHRRRQPHAHVAAAQRQHPHAIAGAAPYVHGAGANWRQPHAIAGAAPYVGGNANWSQPHARGAGANWRQPRATHTSVAPMTHDMKIRAAMITGAGAKRAAAAAGGFTANSGNDTSGRDLQLSADAPEFIPQCVCNDGC